MGSWISEFAHNFSDMSFYPLLVATVACVGILMEAANVRMKSRNDTAIYHARWRQFASVQGLAIAWLLWIVAASVPAPDYQIHTVTKEVVKFVPKVITKVKTKEVVRTVVKNTLSSYSAAYDECKRTRPQSTTSEQDDATCNTRALAIARPDIKVFKVRTVQVDPYSKLFDDCNYYNAKNSDVRTERLQLCHKQAMEVRRSMGLGR